MGNIYRFVEPVILLTLREKSRSYGYELAATLTDYALTDAAIEGAALYRTLRRLEANGYVNSEWDANATGPARRVYLLTREGEQHLNEWAAVLENLGKAMGQFAKTVRNRRESKPAFKAERQRSVTPRNRTPRKERAVTESRRLPSTSRS